MKRLILVVTAVLLAISVLMAGCTKATPAPDPTQKVTGIPKAVNTPKEAGQDAITVQTPQGPTVIQITPQTGLSFNGQACTVDELDALIAANLAYNCTIVFDPMLGATAVYVTGAPNEAVTGALKDVNTPKEAGQDAITVQTPQGPTVIQITPQTGLSFNGQACTVDELDAKIAAGTSYNCTIVFDPMLGATAVYVTGP